MADVSSSNASAEDVYSEESRRALSSMAHDSIAHGLEHGAPLDVDPSEFPAVLRAPRATFVTLRSEGELRGCIGGFEPRDPLVKDVARRAYDSAFHDPRFPALAEPELAGLNIEISILHPFERIHPASEEELLSMLRPGIDGLLIEDGALRATFLPSVWKELREPRAFLQHLKRKAGMAPDHWSKAMRVSRYTVDLICAPV